MKKGRIHIYTGCGKGKTTASIGLAVRAALSGFRVCMFQFLKTRCSSVDNGLSMPNFKIVCFDERHPMFGGSKGAAMRAPDRITKKILSDIRKVKKVIAGGRYDVIVLDEIINCVSEKFVDEKYVLDLVAAKPEKTELILTGRGATRRLIASADYVTRLDKVKHPFDKGLAARRGIEY